MKKLASIVLMVWITLPVIQAQIEIAPSQISASGSFSENESFSITWTLGQLAVTTLQSGNLVLTQGFLQPIVIETNIQNNEMEWDISVYPNPFHNDFIIQFNIKESSDFQLEIHDVTGRVMKQELLLNVMQGNIIKMDMSGYKSGVYFLRILTPEYKQVKVLSLRKL